MLPRQFVNNVSQPDQALDFHGVVWFSSLRLYHHLFEGLTVGITGAEPRSGEGTRA